jgi:hypothetical protein
MNLPEKMEQSLTAELSSLTINLSEVGLDTALQEGLFRDIPIFGSVVSLGKGIISIPEILLFRKLTRFLLRIKTTT